MEETTKVYLAIKGDEVVWHTDPEVMKRAWGVTKFDMIVTKDEFIQAKSLARLVDGKIVLGETDAEKNIRDGWERIGILKQQLTDTDYVACKIAEDPDCRERYAEILQNRKDWRTEIDTLQTNIVKWQSELS